MALSNGFTYNADFFFSNSTKMNLDAPGIFFPKFAIVLSQDSSKFDGV
jgi:ribosome biogenesis GTPase A